MLLEFRMFFMKLKQLPQLCLRELLLIALMHLQIKQSLKKKVSIGKKEGLRLDDGFHIAEFYEDKDGETKIKINGFSRVAKTGNNINNPF